MEGEKKRLRGKQPAKTDDVSDISKRKPVVETVGTYQEKKKRLR